MDHILALCGRYPSYHAVLDWIDTFVLRPNAALGRRGAVCPLLAPAIRRNMVRIVAVPTMVGSPTEAVEIGLNLADLYVELFAAPSEFRTGALMAVFPDLPPDAAAAFIDEGHARLRERFVAKGLMLGEFHPTSQVGSVRNPDLHVMRCPVPMFAIRALTSHDLLFLDTPQSPPDVRTQYLRHVLRFAGDQLTPHQHAHITAALTTALATMEDDPR